MFGIKTDYILEGSSIIFEDGNGTMLYYTYSGVLYMLMTYSKTLF